MKYIYQIDKRYKITFIITMLAFVVVLILLSSSQDLMAKEFNVEEALQWGILNNLDLQSLRYGIEDIRRNLAIAEAGKSFQVDLSVTPIWRFGDKDNSYFVESDENRFTPDTKLNLSLKKMLTPKLSMAGEVSWQSDNLSKDFMDVLTDGVKANIRLDQKLYPQTWTEQEKQTYSLENNLQTKIEELRWKEIEKQIEFIQKYLNIIRLQEQLDIMSERYRLAEENLVRVRTKIELGEGGYLQESEAMISLNEAENKLTNLKQDLTMAKKQWHLLLNLPVDANINFNADDLFLKDISKQMEDLPIGDKTERELIEKALKENYQTGSSELEIEELEKELQWAKDAGKPAVNISGGYSYPDSNWFVMLDFSVKLSDGGAQKLKVEQKEDNLKRKKISTAYQLEMLRIEAEQLFSQDEYNQLFLQTQELSLEKEREKDKIVEQQYQQGIISLLQRTNNLLTVQEKELSTKQARDQWLTGRLKLAHFIGYFGKGA